MLNYEERFARNLKRLRKSHELTQEQLANELGYSKKTVSKWECGNCIPDVGTLFTIAKILHVNLEALFSGEQCFLLGIDGGGTKTELALTDERGNVIRTLTADTCNPIDVGLDNARNVLRNAIYEICDDIPLSSIVMYAGIAGGTTTDMHRKLKEFFQEFGFLAFLNDSDNKLIISAGLGDRDGVSLIMGTGICAYTQLNGIQSRTAGWGYFIDGGGSAYNIGRDALGAYFAALDHSGEKTLISEQIDLIYPHGANSLIGYIYDGGKKNIASFAPAAVAAFKCGDRVAEKILQRNMACAAHIMETAARGFKQGPVDVVLAGGLTNEPVIIELFKSSVSDRQRYNIRKLDEKPVMGAVKLAKKLLMEMNGNA